MRNFEIDFVKYFNDEEKNEVKKFVSENIADMELHRGWNYSVDVSDAVNRTANVDIYVD